jgi:superfamily II DNA/RNA helicase
MPENILPGALVFDKDLEIYGVVMRVHPGQVQVFLDSNTTKIFSDLSRIERVEFGQRVQQHHPKRSGFKLAQVSVDPPVWKVAFGMDEAPMDVPEANLRPDDSLDPYERVVDGKDPGEGEQTLLTTFSHYLLNEHKNNDLVALDTARVDVKPHQVSVIHRVVSNYPHRYLLCDEVGLGKTIEAGMIMKELRARGLADRVLIIVPSNLKRQWQFELKSKFNEIFSILDSSTLRVAANDGTGENPFARFKSVIVSEAWISDPKNATEVEKVAWDLVIVDEAHHARRHKDRTSTRLYELVYRLTDSAKFPDRAVLFLTATPMQLHSYELFSLIEMIDPTLFPSYEDFSSHSSKIKKLKQLANRIDAATDLNELDEDSIEELAKWLNFSDSEVRSFLTSESKAVILERLGKEHRLTEILIRNRKAKVLGFMERRAFRWDVELTVEEEEIINQIEDYVESGYRAADASGAQAIGFLMTTFQKMTASSLSTIKESLIRRRNRLSSSDPVEEDLEEDNRALLEDLEIEFEESGISTSDLTFDKSVEIGKLNKLINSLEQIKIDSKAQVLISKMKSLAEDEVPKVLIFTEYRATQAYLADLLEKEGWGVNLFHGSQSAMQRDDSVEAFRSNTGPQVLISTEAGAEGRNFQFCHLLVNYDLPWNPMTVEQRIGRIDRMGQQNIVMVFNFCVKNSIEERVLEVLDRRINLFENTIGGLDPILGEVAGELREIMKKARDDRPAALEELGAKLELGVEEAREANENLQDLIMDTKSYSREIAERIQGEKSQIDPVVQEEYMKRLLVSQRTRVRRNEREREYEVNFFAPFTDKYPDIFRHADELKRRVVFRNDERQDSDFVQYMAFGHPVIDAAVSEVTAPLWPGSVGARLIQASDGQSEVSGWFFLYSIEIPDIRKRTKLVPVFISNEGKSDDQFANSLVLRIAERLPEERGVIDEDARQLIKKLKPIADEEINDEVKNISAQIKANSQERIDKELEKLEKYYSNRIDICQMRIESTENTIAGFRSSSDLGEQKILPVWQARLKKEQELQFSYRAELTRRKADLELLRNPSCTQRLVQAVFVKVCAV